MIESGATAGPVRQVIFTILTKAIAPSVEFYTSVFGFVLVQRTDWRAVLDQPDAGTRLWILLSSPNLRRARPSACPRAPYSRSSSTTSMT